MNKFANNLGRLSRVFLGYFFIKKYKKSLSKKCINDIVWKMSKVATKSEQQTCINLEFFLQKVLKFY